MFSIVINYIVTFSFYYSVKKSRQFCKNAIYCNLSQCFQSSNVTNLS